MDIDFVTESISKDRIKELAEQTFGDMVKGVVDLEKKVMTIGGQMHVDGEAILLDKGSREEDTWGFSIYPDRTGDDYLQYASMVNIKPTQNNRGREIQDQNIRDRVKEVVLSMIK